MLIEDLIGSSVGLGIKEVQTIKAECSQFLQETVGCSLMKNLPSSYSNFHRVKVRLQKRKDQVTDVFERAFGHTFNNIRQRAVFSSPTHPDLAEGMDAFYVFPIDGYKYMYSREVTDSSADYKQVIDTLIEQFDDPSQASDVVADLLKYTYSCTSLREGIASGSEIIMYGIPYYYVVRAAACHDYQTMLNMAK